MALAFLNGLYSGSGGADSALLKSLIDRSITEIEVPEGVTEIGDCAFRSCTKLERVILPKGLKKINAFAFYVIKSLQEIEIPEGVEFIGGSVFSGCSNLSRVSLPESVTAIGSTAFNGTAITEFVYPDKVSVIDDRIFLGCKNLSRVVAPSACTQVETYAFGSCPLCVTYDFTRCVSVPRLLDVLAFENINPEAQILVPAALYDEWVAATNWVEFKDYIVASSGSSGEGGGGSGIPISFSAEVVSSVAGNEGESFTFEGEEGMTWSDWCGSEYNTLGALAQDGMVYFKRPDDDFDGYDNFTYIYYSYVGSDAALVTPENVIEAGHNYHFVEW